MNKDDGTLQGLEELWRARFRQELDARNIDRKKLSDDCDLSLAYASRVQSGTINPSVSNLLKLCHKAGIEPSLLFMSEEEAAQAREIFNKVKSLTQEEGELVARLLESFRSK